MDLRTNSKPKNKTARRIGIAVLLLICFGLVVTATVGSIRQGCIFQTCVSPSSAMATTNIPVPMSSSAAPVHSLGGVAILGASTQDEYRADDQRGGTYSAATFNWVELLVRYRNVDVGPWGTRSEPRRSGYEYNWARSSDTTQSMLDSGQHTGAAQQIRDGKVSHVIIQIGGNDFAHDNVAADIYTGRLAGTQLNAKLTTMATHVEAAILALKAAGNVQILLAAMPDYLTPSLIPEEQDRLVDSDGRQRLVDAFAALNQQLAQVASHNHVVFFDFNAAFQAELARRVDVNHFLLVGGERIDLTKRGNEPHHGLLEDDSVHPGTVLSSIFANVYIHELNAVYGTSIVPLSDDEILHIAGINP